MPLQLLCMPFLCFSLPKLPAYPVASSPERVTIAEFTAIVTLSDRCGSFPATVLSLFSAIKLHSINFYSKHIQMKMPVLHLHNAVVYHNL